MANQTTENRLNLDVIIVNDDQVLVSSQQCSTTFANTKFIEFDVDKLIKDLTRLIAEAKEKGVRLRQATTILKTIKDKRHIIDCAIQQYKNLFEQYKKYWLHKIEEGIYRGYSGDESLNQSYELRNKIDTLFRHSEALGNLSDLVHQVERYIGSLDSYSMVTLHFNPLCFNHH
jgi:hypothetical protein